MNQPAVELMTVEQIASELGVHTQTAQRYFREEGLPGRKIGHAWKTTRVAYETWLADWLAKGNLTAGPPPVGPEPAAGLDLEHK